MTTDSSSIEQDSAPSRRAIGVAFLMLATLACYLPALRGDFVWDDDQHVSTNPTLRSLAGLRDIWLRRGATLQYYPLTYTSFWVEYHVWGLSRVGYHLTNVLLHGINAVLAWELLRRLGVPGAFLAAAVFALHPVNVESVAWISERKNVLATCLMLLSMLAYLGYVRGGYWASLLLFVGALLSKTVTCSMPAVLILILWWRGQLTRKHVSDLLPFFALGLGLGWGTARMEAAHVGARGADWDLSPAQRCIIASRAVWFYVRQLVWPADLSFTYTRWTIDARDPRQWSYAAALVAVVGVLGLGLRRWGRGPLVAVLIFVGTLFPALGFINVYPMRWSFVADHFQYLSSIAIIALVAAALAVAVRRVVAAPARVGLSVAGAAVVLSILGVLTWRQSRVYRDSVTLWRDALRKQPGSWLALHQLASALYENGRLAQEDGRRADARAPLEEAVVLFEKSKQIRPSNLVAGLTRARALDRLERSGEAMTAYDQIIAELKQHLAGEPRDTRLRAELGNVLARLGRYDEARAEFERALRDNPNESLARKGVEALRGAGLVPAPRPGR
jgi:hypothetical protein